MSEFATMEESSSNRAPHPDEYIATYRGTVSVVDTKDTTGIPAAPLRRQRVPDPRSPYHGPAYPPAVLEEVRMLVLVLVQMEESGPVLP